MRVRNGVRSMRVGLFSQFGWHQMQISVTHAGLGDRGVREFPRIRGMPLQYSDLQAVFVIKVDMKGRQHEIVMVVLGSCQSLRQFALVMIEDVRKATHDVRAFVRRQPIGIEPLPQQIANCL